MKFVCERCQTKYSIADEKVRQKVLKIRCKTCENVITIRDAVVVNEPAAPRVDPPPAPIVAATPRSIEWHLAVSGQQSGPFGLAALVTRILGADRNEELYVWNEHLDGWKEPKQVPEVASEMRLRAAAVDPPKPPPKRLPSPAGLGHVRGPGASAAPAVSRGRSSGAMAALAPFGAPGEDEKTQISPLDASMLLDPSAAPTRGQPSLSLLGKTGEARGPERGGAASDRGAAEAKRGEAKAPDAHRPSGAPAPVASNGYGARKTAMMGSASSGLEALDFAPPLVAPSHPAGDAKADAKADHKADPKADAKAAAANGVPSPVLGGSTSMLLSQVGARASRPRHPAVKFAVMGGVLLVLFGVIGAVMLTSSDSANKADQKPSSKTPIANAPDPEAQARAEAEKYFKSMVGETGGAEKASTKSVGPAPTPKRSNPTTRATKNNPEPSTPPPLLAPPPVGAPGVAPPAPTEGSRVTQRFAQDERKVAVPAKERRAAADFDIQKFALVFKQPDHFAAIKSCYERALKRDESLKGARLDIQVTVSDTGNAKKVKVLAPPEFTQVSNCIQDAVRRWRFPPDVKEYDASFPLILQGKSE